jgi:hypothetical protein
MAEQPPAPKTAQSSAVPYLSLVPFETVDDRAPEHQRCAHHGAFVINAKRRTCACKVCGAEVDPYLAIELIGRSWKKWASAEKWAKARALAAREQRDHAEKQLANVKARLRRWKAKLPLEGTDA